MSESGDKRSVHTDALATLGTIIDENTGGRDAIHLAVEPTVCKELKLHPGQDVGADGSLQKPWVGIVDPFLKQSVRKGERFWLILYPRTITALRHVWEHPAFPPEDSSKRAIKMARLLSGESEQWLKDIAGTGEYPSYEALIAAVRYREEEKDFGDYLHIDGEDASGEIKPEFWDHVETVLGKDIPIEHRAKYFSCSC